MTALRRELFGTLPDGRRVEQYTLENAHGMRVAILSFGGIVRSITLPRRDAAPVDVVLGFDTLEAYLADRMFVGALIGRYANRIANASFALDGERFVLPPNAGPNIIHGGIGGFHRVLWSLDERDQNDGRAVALHYRSVDGDQGFPGTLDVTATYALSDNDELALSFETTTDAPTPVALTAHGYFNLAGHDTGSALAHELTVAASSFTPVTRELIPTGEVRPVDETPFDFRAPTAIGARLGVPDGQLALTAGYDHNFVIDRADGGLVFAASLCDPRSGRRLAVYTTEPGIQIYIGGGLNVPGKSGARYVAHSGIALEPQHFPNSPNEPLFPSTILRPGELLRSHTVFRFEG